VANYEYGRIKVLANKLNEAGIDQNIFDQILAGGESILSKTSAEKKAEWMKGAMDRMNDLLDTETRYAVREACACCLGGKRFEISKGIAKKYQTLEDRIKAANDARFVFGHSVTMQDDGKILVSFFPDGLDHYGCPCMPKAKERISITHCYCCGGHVKHHLQTALGEKMSVQVVSSSLSSGGKNPCKFLFTIEK
jgi:hypothetical protein